MQSGNWPKNLAALLAVGVNVWGSIQGFLPSDKAALYGSVLAGLYMILHTIDQYALSKQGQQPAK